MKAANYNYASTESDKHEMENPTMIIPRGLPPTMTSTHPFYWSGSLPWNNAFGGEGTDTYRNAWDTESHNILELNLNNPYIPISAAWISQGGGTGTAEYTSSQPVIFNQTGRYSAQGLGLLNSQYSYFKCVESEWEIEFYNFVGYEDTTAMIPVRIYSYHQNGTNDITATQLSADTQTNRRAVVALQTNPRVNPVCGGAPLGTIGAAVNQTGVLTENIQDAYAPMLSTRFKWNANKSQASDPAAADNIVYWTSVPTSAALPAAPTVANIQKLRFFAINAGATNFTDATGGVRWGFRIKANFTVQWRDVKTDNLNITDVQAVV